MCSYLVPVQTTYYIWHSVLQNWLSLRTDHAAGQGGEIGGGQVKLGRRDLDLCQRYRPLRRKTQENAIKRRVRHPAFRDADDTHCSPLVLSPPTGSSVSRAPSKNIEHVPQYDVGTAGWPSADEEPLGSNRNQPYRPRPAMLPSSLGSKEEEEEDRCENAALSSAAICTELVVAPGTEDGGWGLRSPVRLSRGTGVMDTGVTSPVLTGGFTWFLLGGVGKMTSQCWKHRWHTMVTSVSCGACSSGEDFQ